MSGRQRPLCEKDRALSSVFSCTHGSAPFVLWWMAQPRREFTHSHLPVHMWDHTTRDRLGHGLWANHHLALTFEGRSSYEATCFRYQWPLLSLKESKRKSRSHLAFLWCPLRVWLTQPLPQILFTFILDLITSPPHMHGHTHMYMCARARERVCAHTHTSFLFFHPSYKENSKSLKGYTRVRFFPMEMSFSGKRTIQFSTHFSIYFALKAQEVKGNLTLYNWCLTTKLRWV